ncbi:MAG: MCE family protein [Cyanobacteria bacterium Co-bin13]|nr:MCE family protein [Cyanobacteria bacterium Co-bin13]
MRARAIREGSVGLLILISVALFGGLVLWLRGISPGRRTYQIGFVFENTLGMQAGTVVRYRGVPVGRVLAISPAANEVSVLAEITATNLRIPKAVEARANQSGLIGDTTIDLTPLEILPEDSLALTPFDEDCNPQLIVCNGDVLPGLVGASYESLLRSAERLANTYSDPLLVADLQSTLSNASVAAAKAGVVADELTGLTQSVRAEVQPLSASARRAADSVGSAAAQFELTGAEVNRLVVANQANLSQTLTNVNASSQRLLAIMNDLEPAVRDSQFIANLDALSANALLATNNLRDITGVVNTRENLSVLQQTLDSARNVFQSAQKVLADVDELTGDPAFRMNLRNLVNGLSDLVSSTGTLEQQAQLAQMLAPAAGHETATLTLTALPELTPAQATTVPGPLLMASNGQYYRLEFVQPGGAAKSAVPVGAQP